MADPGRDPLSRRRGRARTRPIAGMSDCGWNRQEGIQGDLDRAGRRRDAESEYEYNALARAYRR